MLMAAEPQHFSEHVLAELRGWFDPDGTCPFWEMVGCKFFRLPFDQADMASASTDGQFILDLAPAPPDLCGAAARAPPATASAGCIGRASPPG